MKDSIFQQVEDSTELLTVIRNLNFESGNFIMQGVYEVKIKEGSLFKIGTLIFKTDPYTLIKNQQPVKLRLQEGIVLSTLLAAPTFFVSRLKLMNALWPGIDKNKVDCNGRLNVTVDRLKKALEVDPTIHILCQRGIGYKLFVEAE